MLVANIFSLCNSVLKSLLCWRMLKVRITRRQILDSSKLKDFADDNLKFVENGSKLFKPVENTVGKGEQFLLFPQCFQKACFPEASKGVVVWEWVVLRMTTPSRMAV